MQEYSTTTLQGLVTIDKCTDCGGIWFDKGEAEILKGDWMSDFLDSGDPMVGKKQNLNTEVNCPRCGSRSRTLSSSTSSTRCAKITVCSWMPASSPTTRMKPW